MDGDKLAIVRSYWSAEGRGRLDEVMSHFGREAEVVSGSRTFEGRERIGEFYREILASNDEIVVTPTHHIEQGNEIAVEFTCSMLGTAGEKKRYVGCNVFLIENGLIQRMRSYVVPAVSSP